MAPNLSRRGQRKLWITLPMSWFWPTSLQNGCVKSAVVKNAMDTGGALSICSTKPSCRGFANAGFWSSLDHSRAATMLARGIVVACMSAVLAYLAALSAGKLNGDAPTLKKSLGRERAGLLPVGPVHGRDFAWRWIDTQTRPETSSLDGGNWFPAGGLATLLWNVKSPEKNVANRLAPEVRDAAPLEADLRHPLKMQAPVPTAVRAQGSERTTVAAQTADAPKPGDMLSGLDFFFRFFEPKPDTAYPLLASNPKTAVYDISAHTVYMPDGKKLEAHSGFGEFLDDPSSVGRRDLGPTPPNIYRLSLRPALFHGVQALRMTPAGDGKMFGRNGFLAHPYMLGEDGASNGCLSLRNYEAFLRAYQVGEVKQVIVLPRLDAKPAKLARADPVSR